MMMWTKGRVAFVEQIKSDPAFLAVLKAMDLECVVMLDESMKTSPL